jgi:DNA-binding NtrC family response regulator
MMFVMTGESGDPTILIIDDERTFADTLAKRLSMRGIDCAVAYDAYAGLALVAERSFTGLVLDLRLPDLDGCEVLRRIMRLHPGLPVVILTGHGTEDDERECMKNGARAFLNKPVDLARLVQLLAQNESGDP